MIDDHARLAELITEWLPSQRWYGSKGRAVTSMRVEDDIALLQGDPALHQLIVGVSYDEGEGEHYQLLVGLRREGRERVEHAGIGQLGDQLVYEAAHDTELMAVLLTAIAEGRTEGDLRFMPSGNEPIDTTPTSRLITNEQSNSSLVY